MNTSISSAVAEELLASLGMSSAAKEPKEAPAPSNHYSPGTTSSIEERARTLLGSGIAAESVAAALGVTPSRIAQLLSNETFAESVAKLRYESLQQHNKRDSHYDRLEDTLLDKLERSIALLYKPQDILKAISTINGAKRRGQSSPEQVTNQQNIVNLVLPVSIAQKFSVNIDNQVTRAGEQDLLTMPSSNLLRKVEEAASIKKLQQDPQPEQTQCEIILTDQEELRQS